MHRHTTFAFTVLLTATAIAQTPPATPDIAADLKHKQFDKRVAAIAAIAASDRKDADALLLPLLKENDFEIQEHAAQAMGKRKNKAAMPALLDLAVDADIARVRHAAALAINTIDPVDGAANVTVTPLTGLLLASRTVTWSEDAKAVVIAVDCGVLPALAVMLAAAPAVLVRAKLAGVAKPAALAVTL